VYLLENKCHHWFDGDAMIHAIRIKNGKLYYCNRYLNCWRLQTDRKAGKVVTMRIGEMDYPSGIMKMLLN